MPTRFDSLDSMWVRATAGPRDPATAREQGKGLPRSVHEARADELTKRVRELTEAQTKERLAHVAKLKAARLARDAEVAAALAAAPPPEPKKPRKKAAGPAAS